MTTLDLHRACFQKAPAAPALDPPGVHGAPQPTKPRARSLPKGRRIMARPASIHEATTPHHLVTPAEQCLASCGGAKDAPGPVRLAAPLSSVFPAERLACQVRGVRQEADHEDLSTPKLPYILAARMLQLSKTSCQSDLSLPEAWQRLITLNRVATDSR
jgi:hypothetical protein